ncbi:MAG: hypothetical protein Q9225_005685 [Loekoesia sp. 1 TL-2023]
MASGIDKQDSTGSDRWVSIQALLSPEQSQIIDLVDHLRRTGLGGVLKLPQLVVCGDQSSGKSSVLEAITEIPFPRKENLCTRFATEIVLRNHDTASVTTKITPDKQRPAAEQAVLEGFQKSISDLSELPTLINEATIKMGLEQSGDHISTRAFTRDVLSIEICGPNRPQLTLVDLPGLIHAENRSQTMDDVELIRGIVEDYIKNDRTIILPVISAKNDYANQIILQNCRKVDPKGTRTLGIVTKPDFLTSGSENERTWIELVKNHDIVFELGWHVLKNRTDTELNTTLEERNTSENVFFSKGSWSNLSKDQVGVESLRGRLSLLLGKHLKKELPGLRTELENKLAETKGNLEQLSERRSTTHEQRQFLTRVSMDVHEIIKAAVKGYYELDFFGKVDVDAAVDAPSNMQRLRAAIHHLNFRFSSQMRVFGHRYAIGNGSKAQTDSSSVGNAEEDEDESTNLETVKRRFTDALAGESIAEEDSYNSDGLALEEGLSAPKRLSRSKAVDWVLHILQRTRGRELPGTFNPLVIGQIFKEQSAPWKTVAVNHIEKTAAVCDVFVRRVIDEKVPAEVRERLWDFKVEPALKASLSSSRQELRRILEDKERHPITYNHYFTTTIQKLRQQKLGAEISNLADRSKSMVQVKSYAPGSGYREQEYIDPLLLEMKLGTFVEHDMDRFAAEEILDQQSAFFKVNISFQSSIIRRLTLWQDELKYFIGVVAKQVIERHLVDTLPANIFSPVIVAGLSDGEVFMIAAESAEITRQRESLESLRSALENGRRKFRQIVGSVGPIG